MSVARRARWRTIALAGALALAITAALVASRGEWPAAEGAPRPDESPSSNAAPRVPRLAAPAESAEGEEARDLAAVAPSRGATEETRAPAPSENGVLLGRVRTALGAPVAGARLDLLAPGSLPGPRPAAAKELARWEARRRALDGLGLARTAWTDAEGAFRLGPVPPRGFDLVVRVAPGVREGLRVPPLAPRETRALEVVVPPLASVRGRVVLPACVEARALVAVLRPADRDLDADVEAPLARDGSFELGPVVAGRRAIELRLPGVRVALRPFSEEVPGPVVPLGAFVLAPGHQEIVLDARPSYPRPVVVRVRSTSGAGAPWRLAVLRESDGRVVTLGVTDGEGHATIERVAPGRYLLAATAADAGACPVLSAPFDAAPGAGASLTIEVAPLRGTLAILDADGAPLAGALVQILPERLVELGTAYVAPATLVADAAGLVGLEAPAGRYRCHLARRADDDATPAFPGFARDAPSTPFDWPAPGVRALEIRLPRGSSERSRPQ